MKVKKEAVIEGIKMPMRKVWFFYHDLCSVAGVEAVITDGMRESTPGKYSLHEDGYALDLRLRELPIERGKEVAKVMKALLGPDYDVIYYEKYRHMHVEYQRHLDDKREWVNLNFKKVQYVD